MKLIFTYYFHIIINEQKNFKFSLNITIELFKHWTNGYNYKIFNSYLFLLFYVQMTNKICLDWRICDIQNKSGLGFYKIDRNPIMEDPPRPTRRDALINWNENLCPYKSNPQCPRFSLLTVWSLSIKFSLVIIITVYWTIVDLRFSKKLKFTNMSQNE